MQDKRSAILRATFELVSEHGFHGAPMSKIAERAQVGAGTIYRYFTNKDALIRALYVELKVEMGGAMIQGINTEAPLQDYFQQMWGNMVRHCLAHPKETLFLEQFANSPMCHEVQEQLHASVFGALSAAFEKAVRDGVIKPLSPEAIRALAFAPAMSLVKSHNAGAMTLDDDAIATIAAACWDSIKS